MRAILHAVDDLMMPNVDPRTLKRMMESMGMKNTEIDAKRVIIEGVEKDIIIDNPSVTMIEMQGNRSFQVVGEVSERTKEKEAMEITKDDIEMVKEQAGISDDEAARKALEETGGDIAEAILKLKGGKG
jgi:nascent polypeptide-associated complex subunit alpha